MKNRSPEIDAYIAKSADFAKPILTRIRKLFHQACPDIEETMKWSFPHFQFKGIVGGMASFKQHVAFGFWKGKLLKDPHNLFRGVGKTSMNTMKISDVSALPPDKVLLAYIVEAIALNENDVKVPQEKKRKTKKEPLPVPDDLAAALRKNKEARKTFEAFSPSHQREYIEWVTEAKQQATRDKRLAKAIAWMSDGKSRNWKYIQ